LDFSYSLEDIESLPDIGPEIAQNVKIFFTEKKELLRELLEVLEVNF